MLSTATKCHHTAYFSNAPVTFWPARNGVKSSKYNWQRSINSILFFLEYVLNSRRCSVLCSIFTALRAIMYGPNFPLPENFRILNFAHPLPMKLVQVVKLLKASRQVKLKEMCCVRAVNLDSGEQGLTVAMI